MMLRPLGLVPPAVCLIICSLSSAAQAQLTVLSPSNETQQWRDLQIATLEQQIDQTPAGSELRQELGSQLKWLNAWTPGKLGSKPLWPGVSQLKQLTEPTLDPSGKAGPLREKLLAKGAHPTAEDTEALRQLLAENPGDVGVRQLHLHWLDQPQYRKTYPDEIAAAALYLLGLIEQLEPQSRDTQLARTFCLYRRGRALAYRELPEVVAESPIADPESHGAKLLGAYQQLTDLAGKNRPEFILLDIRMLRRDRWFGRALVLLEDHAGHVERRWFLKKRRDLLQELGWEAAYSEAAEEYAREFPEEVAKEEGRTAR